ncbi:hypothetical protein D0Z08_08855 [Nocardioides immobilis]|uniref:Tat pathway signal sequence domain protein n=1 Tax=Nocardioides immobilis TaxID=2049295 RepID=A0A417Y3V3_9ACTN|nr:hypothetical protein [Nocardioides immobilis]RHW27266.1 hypothetical protein D0Z08_08855 [Nocardioides immobilis]
MRSTQRLSRRVLAAVLGALSVSAILVPGSAAPAAAEPTTPPPFCAGAKDLAVDVTQDVRDQPLLPARDGHMWARFNYTQHLRIWQVGDRQYCVRKDYEGTWESVAGLSPGLTGTIPDGLTGTFHGSEYWQWTGRLAPVAPTTGHLGEVDADCTDIDVCADDSYLIVTKYYFSQGTQHCVTVRANIEVDGGEHGHLSLTYNRGRKVSGTGDITS